MLTPFLASPNALACMSGGQLLIILCIVSLVPLTLVLVGGWVNARIIQSLFKNKLKGRPATLFLFAAGLPLLTTAVSIAAIALIFPKGGGVDVALLSVVLIVCTLTVGLLVFGLRKEQVSEPEPQRLPYFQRIRVWLMDLVVATLCFGAGLTLLNATESLHGRESAFFLAWAIYIFSVGAVGLLIGLDVASSTQLGRSTVQRGLLLTGIFTLMPVAWPFITAGWWAWRRALRLAARERASAAAPSPPG